MPASPSIVPSNAGPTRLADIANLASPGDAPLTIRFSGPMTALFQSLWAASFPGGKPKEQGGTIVADKDGNFSLQHIGGKGSTDNEIEYIFSATDPSKFSVVGTFHTHPYEHQPATFTGAPFSGGDYGLTLGRADLILGVLLSHGSLFVHVQTARSPVNVPQMVMHKAMEGLVGGLQTKGQSFESASRSANRMAAKAANVAYYQGANGIATKV